MANFALLSARQNLVHAERLGQIERAKRIKARIVELETLEAAAAAPALSMDNTKAELLAAAEGLDVDESNTKAEILEALNG